MSTVKQLMHNSKENKYFSDLPVKTQEIVKEAILKAAEDKHGPECYPQDKDCVEEIECHSRDGFIAAGHNKGGFLYRNFNSLMDYFGGGYSVAHADADKEIQRQIDYSLQCVSDQLKEEIGEELLGRYLKPNEITYGGIESQRENFKRQGDLESAELLRKWSQRIQDIEYDYLSGEYSSIMHELRFMYHGKENGLHSASVSAAVNTEGPYHRTHIQWAPNVFCEGSKEVEITWHNNAELKRKLDKAFKQVSKVIF